MVDKLCERDFRFRSTFRSKSAQKEKSCKKRNPLINAFETVKVNLFSKQEQKVLVNEILSWEEACLSVAKTNGLSWRESEVLYLLSIERNTQRMSEILHVSTSTTKTHVSHIYKKMNLHSQQEIIDSIELRVWQHGKSKSADK